jgi:hypothetical protein
MYLEVGSPGQCSRLKSSYEFQFEGLSNFSPLVEGLVKIQNVNSKNMKMNNKIHIKFVHELHGTCFQDNEKNQESTIYPTCCSDNVLCLLILVTCRLYRGLQLTSSFSIWSCVLKG